VVGFEFTYEAARYPTIGRELAIKWEDGTESFIGLEKLRDLVPAPDVAAKRTLWANVYKVPERPLTPQAFELRSLKRIDLWNPANLGGRHATAFTRSII